MIRLVPSSLLLIFVLTGPASAGGVQVRSPRTGKVLGVANGETVLVKFKPGKDKPSREKVHKKFGTEEREDLGNGWHLVKLPPGRTVEDGLRFYGGELEVENVEPNFILRASLTPNDPRIPEQYALSKMSLFQAWDFETGSSTRTRIVLIDSGVRSTHQDLSGKVDEGNAKTFCPSTSPPPAGCGGGCTTNALDDELGHGTAVAGVAGAKGGDGVGIAGASWVFGVSVSSALLVPVKIFGDQNCSETGQLINAIRYSTGVAVSTGERMVINMSLGCPPGASGCDDGTPNVPPENQSGCPDSLFDAVRTALNRNIVLVAAAGNQNHGPVDCPARIPGVIAVGATDSADNIASFSNVGPEVLVVAPGVSILTTSDAGNGAYATVDGTSFSSPYVAGVAVLMLARDPAISTTTVIQRLRDGADDVGEPVAYQGYGRVNAADAVVPKAKFGVARLSGRVDVFAAPNPFRVSQDGVTRIRIPPELRSPQNEVKIYNLGGELVRTLSDILWDGRNSQGEPVASGVYVFVVSTEKGVGRGRVAVIR